jgi:hypothetical protein|tara:strand:- start:135 stop:239 length:105 start_codon:yes stop_codon:yes gene_type:complete
VVQVQQAQLMELQQQELVVAAVHQKVVDHNLVTV